MTALVREDVERWPKDATRTAVLALLDERDVLLAAEGRDAARLWTCPACAFAFDAMHTDANGSHSCPACAELKLRDTIDAMTKAMVEQRAIDEQTLRVAGAQLADAQETASRAAAAEIAAREALREATEWIGDNPPANAYGLLDKARDAERYALQERIGAALSAPSPSAALLAARDEATIARFMGEEMCEQCEVTLARTDDEGAGLPKPWFCIPCWNAMGERVAATARAAALEEAAQVVVARGFQIPSLAKLADRIRGLAAPTAKPCRRCAFEGDDPLQCETNPCRCECHAAAPVSPMKAIADDLRAGTFVGVAPAADETPPPRGTFYDLPTLLAAERESVAPAAGEAKRCEAWCNLGGCMLGDGHGGSHAVRLTFEDDARVKCRSCRDTKFYNGIAAKGACPQCAPEKGGAAE